MKKNRKQNNKANTGLIRYIPYLPIVLLFCIHPFVVNYKLYESRLSSFAWAPENPWATDFYLYCKQNFFLLICIITILFTAYLFFNSKTQNEINNLRKYQNMLIPLGVYAILTIVSGMFSEYKSIVFTGSDGQFESLFIILGYLLCFSYFILLCQREEEFKIVPVILWVFLTLTAILGLLQLTGNNPMSWEWFQKLITPKGYFEAGNTITSVFDSNQVYLFSYNPNYAGVLLALLSGFCFGMFITESGSLKRIMEAVLLLCLIVSLVGTGSKAGLLTFAAVVVLVLLYRIRNLWKYWYVVIPAITLVVGIILLVINLAQLPILDNIKTAFTLEKQKPNPLEEMVTGTDKVNFKYREVAFSVAFDYWDGNFDFNVMENSGNIPLRLSDNHEVYYLERSGLEDVTIRPGIVDNTLPLFVITLNGREWMFIKTEQGYLYLNQYLRLESLQNTERIGFDGYETFASNRGYIWSLTFPLLKDTLLLGTGADTFVCYYPQNNYKDLYYYNGDAVVSSRPHSMYLKIAVESGVPALVSLLVFFAWYIIRSLRLYWKSGLTTIRLRVGFSCFVAVIIYLICGLTNDSMLTVAPVFWGILGTGIAANNVNIQIAD